MLCIKFNEVDADQRICEEGINRFAHFTGKCIQNYSSEQIKAGQGSKWLH